MGCEGRAGWEETRWVGMVDVWDARDEQNGYKPDVWGMVDVWDARDEQNGCKLDG